MDVVISSVLTVAVRLKIGKAWDAVLYGHIQPPNREHTRTANAPMWANNTSDAWPLLSFSAYAGAFSPLPFPFYP